MATELRYGLRRYPLLVVMFLGLAAVLSAWASGIDKPTFVFPFGRLEPSEARTTIFVVAGLAVTYVAVASYIRFVRRPMILLQKGRATIPLGEFGLRTITLEKGDVLELRDETRRGGWRGVHILHARGAFVVWSSQLANDGDYDRLRKKLDTLRAG